MIADRFVLALNPQHYLNAGDGVGVRETDETSFAASDVIDSLKENDALYINSQSSFDGVFHCINNWKKLPSRQKSQLLDTLSSNVPFLCSSISKLGRGTEHSSHLNYHRNAIQQYVFFLNWMSNAADAEVPEPEKKSSEGGKAAAKPKAVKSKKGSDEGGWDWSNGSSRDRILQALLTAVRCDCSNLFDGPHEQARMIDLCIQSAMQVLESPAAIKKETSKSLAFEILCSAAITSKKSQLVASTLMAAIRKRENEHLSEVAGALAKHAEDKHQSNLIALALITEFVKVEPSGYDDEAGQSNTTSVKHQADMIACLAELAPRTVSQNMSRLIPYLACNTYQVRSSIVHMLAATLAQSFSTSDASGTATAEADERGQQSRLTSKQHCIMLLLQRINDKSAYTRKEVLKAWAALAEQEGAIPLPLFPKLVQSAHSRLQDGSVMVVKEALRLLQTLIACAPFGSKLDASAMLATLREIEGRLDDLRRTKPSAFEDYVSEEAEEKAKGEEEEAGEWEKKEAVADALASEAKDGEIVDDVMDVDGEGAADVTSAVKPNQSPSAAPAPAPAPALLEASESQPQPSLSALGSLGDDVTTLRTLVATLKTGIHFIRCVLASLPEVRGLLSMASSSTGGGSNAEVVKEALGLLAMCRKVKLMAGARHESLFEQSQGPSYESSSSQDTAHGHERGEKQPRGGGGGAGAGGEESVLKEAEEVSAESSIRATWPLVFSRDEAVREAVVDSLYHLYLSPSSLGVDQGHSSRSGGASSGHKEAAKELIKLANNATLGELSSLDEILRHLLQSGGSKAGGKDRPYELHKEVILEVVKILRQSLGACLSSLSGSSSPGPALVPLRSSLVILSSISHHAPEILLSLSLPPTTTLVPPSSSSSSPSTAPNGSQPKDFPLLILEVVKASLEQLQDAWVARWSCTVIKGLAPLLYKQPQPQLPPFSSITSSALCAVLCRVILTQGLQDSTWSSAAEAAIDAIYSLHPRPHILMESVLSKSASEAVEATKQGFSHAPSYLARFFFLVGHTALNQLNLIDNLAKRIRRERALGSLEKQEEKEQDKAGGASDLAAQVGMGAAAADAELDAIKEAVDHEIMAGIIGSYGSLIQSVCRSHSLLLSAPRFLRSSALLSLTKLMAVDVKYCEANLHLFFGLLACCELEAALRCNLVVALGDLAFRFPNSLEPWTAHMYHSLGDKDLDVRKRSLSVLSHLVLNDMMKVKGHIARLAICMRSDEDPAIQRTARAFFSTLAAKSHRNSNPIYNLLPDILSHLSTDKNLPTKDAESIMLFLLDYVKQDKQQDSLREKIICRFELVSDPLEWSMLAKCVSSLGYSDKGMRKIVDLLKYYKVALGQTDVYRVFEGLMIHARKHGDKKGDLRDLLVDYEAKIKEAHQALRSSEADQQAAGTDKPVGIGGEEEVEKAEGVDGDDMDVDEGRAVEVNQLAVELEKKLSHQPRKVQLRKNAAGAGKKGSRKKKESSDEEEDGKEEEEEEEGVRGSSKRVASTNPTPAISRRKRREVVCNEDDDNAPRMMDQLLDQ